MIKTPKDFVPYRRLLLCSNDLALVQVPIVAGGTAVLLIGVGPSPRVWLSAPTEQGSITWKRVVADSHSDCRIISILRNERLGSTTIFVEQQIVLDVRTDAEEIAHVDQLDLRPLGLDVHGDSGGLFVGTQRLVGNSFVGPLESAIELTLHPATESDISEPSRARAAV